MSKPRKTPSPRARSLASLGLFFAVGVVTVTGVLAFLLPFSMIVISLHVIFGLAFAGSVVWHLRNNFPNIKGYLKTRRALVVLGVAVVLGGAAFWQIPPVRVFMGLSANTGPSRSRMVNEADHLRFEYAVAAEYQLELDLRKGPAFPDSPPRLAIWLENQSGFHIHTLFAPEDEAESNLPYWKDKRTKWQEARDEAEGKIAEKTEGGEALAVDVVSSPTLNSSFDPAFYILPVDERYTALVEIEVPGNSGVSLIYAVEIDNAEPMHFQVLTRLGTPEKRDDEWQISYDVSELGAALYFLDSVLLTIHRN